MLTDAVSDLLTAVYILCQLYCLGVSCHLSVPDVSYPVEVSLLLRKYDLLITAYILAAAYVMFALLTTTYIRKCVFCPFRRGCVRRSSAASRPSPVKGTASVAAISSANSCV